MACELKDEKLEEVDILLKENKARIVTGREREGKTRKRVTN